MSSARRAAGAADVRQLARLLTELDPAATRCGLAAYSGSVDRLVATAREHGVEAWLAAATPPGEPRWAALGEQRARFAAARLRRLSDLAELGAILTDLDCPWLSMKGEALSRSVYPRPDLRFGVDIDVLVAPRSFEAALAALLGSGYRLVDQNWPVIERIAPAQLKLSSPRGSLVDLHWHLLNEPGLRRAFTLPTGDLLARRRDLGAGVLGLAPIDQFVHVCLHAALSGGTRLSWLLDTALAYRSISPRPLPESGVPAPDEEGALAAVRGTGAGAAVAVMLTRASRYLRLEPSAAAFAVASERAWAAAARSVDRLSPLPADPNRPSVARSLARSVRPTSRAGGAELVRHGRGWLLAGAAREYHKPGWHDPRDSASAMLAVPDPGARRRYFAAVTESAGR